MKCSGLRERQICLFQNTHLLYCLTVLCLPNSPFLFLRASKFLTDLATRSRNVASTSQPVQSGSSAGLYRRPLLDMTSDSRLCLCSTVCVQLFVFDCLCSTVCVRLFVFDCLCLLMLEHDIQVPMEMRRPVLLHTELYQG